MSTTYKATALSAEMASKLSARLNGSLALVQSNDTDQNPVITIGDGVAGHANAVIKTLPQTWPLAQDVLGNAAIQYTPHLMQFVTEADPTSGSGADPTTRAQLLAILGQVLQAGTRVEWYESANGVAPSVAAITTGNLKATFDPDVYRPLLSQQ